MDPTPHAPAPPDVPPAPQGAVAAERPQGAEAAERPRGAMAFVRGRLMGLIERYGTIAIVVYFTIFFLVWASFALAIELGWQPKSVAANAGTWVVAYLVTKLTQPVRIAATVFLTPAVAAVWRRLRRSPAPAAVEPSAAGGQRQE